MQTFVMVYDGKLTGLIELKTWWNVTNAEIDDVRAGSPSLSISTIGRERIDGVHHGRLAIEQTYGYLIFDRVLYGLMTTFNSFVFLKRESPGILYLSDTIAVDCTDPTRILELLYFFSHMCAIDTDEHPKVTQREYQFTSAQLRNRLGERLKSRTQITSVLFDCLPPRTRAAVLLRHVAHRGFKDPLTKDPLTINSV